MEYQSSVVLIILAPFLIFGIIWLTRFFKKSKLWKKTATMEFPTEWSNILEQRFHPYSKIKPVEKEKLHHKILYFIQTKNFTGVAGFVITDEVKLIIAAQACLIIINLKTGVFQGLDNIFIVEDAFIQNDNPINPATGEPLYVARLGEAWKGGPIVLSWKAVLEGLDSQSSKSNVVYHEFTHNLDQQDGHFDGTPELPTQGQYDRWAQIMGEEFIQLRSTVSHHHRSDIDSYGATNEAEFFAVCSEYFFSQPSLLERHHPNVFALYLNYFKIDPRLWY